MCKKKFSEWINSFIEEKKLENEWFLINNKGWQHILNINAIINILTNHFSYEARKMIKTVLEGEENKEGIKSALNTLATEYYDRKLGIC